MNDPNWFGIGLDWRNPARNPDPVSAWQETLTHMAPRKFNTVRLSFGVSGSGASALDFNVLDQVLNLLAQNNIKAILCFLNNPHVTEMVGMFGSDLWINTWRTIAQRYKNDTRIVAYELFNEPWGPNTPQPDTWNHARVNNKWQVAYYIAVLIDQLRALGDNHTCIIPDPQFFYENQLAAAMFRNDGQIYRENTVITVHCWDRQQAAVDWNKQRLDAWSAVMPVWVGETGIRQDQPTDQTYCLQIVNYCVENVIGFNIWFVGYSGGQAYAWTLYDKLLNASNYYGPPDQPPPTDSQVTITISGMGTTDESSGAYPFGSTLLIHSHADEGWHLETMIRNGEPWTSAVTGEFLNLAAVENIEVVFAQDTQPPQTQAGLGIVALIILVLIVLAMVKGGKK